MPDALHEETHRLAVDGDETLDAQDVVALAAASSRLTSGVGLGDDRHLDDEGLEIVVVVPLLRIVMRGTRGEVVLGAGGEAEQDRRVDAALRGAHDLDRARHGGRIARATTFAALLRRSGRSC